MSAERAEQKVESVTVCYATCWACKFDTHDSDWHTWADFEDVEWALASGQPDPSDQKCGCYCCHSATHPTPDADQ